MFFYLSKLFWIIAQPVSAAAILAGLAVVLGLFSLRRLSLLAGGAAFAILALSIWTNLGAVGLQVLENRFSRPTQPPENVAGIIVLGGAFESRVSTVRGQPELNEGGDRMTEAVALARLYPAAKLLISGGSGSLTDGLKGDADLAPAMLERLGVDPARLLREPGSRNTEENVAYSKALAQPQPGETWLLVTSAFHMPRSIGLFREAGWDVVPWPADYRSPGNETPGACRDDQMRCLRQATAAIREWIGLVAYWFTGRIADPFPAP